jgi:hypothetical protein
MFEALKLFQDKAPKNMDVIFSGTFEISSLLQTNPLGKSNVAERLLYSKMYSNKTPTNKTLNQPANKSPNKTLTSNNPLDKPTTNKPTTKPTTNKPTTNKPTTRLAANANKPKSKTLQKNRPNTVIAPLLG